MPRLGLGMPVYNGEAFVAESIESILGQSFGDFELLISDNASTDATEEICRSYAGRDARIRYERQPANIGAGPNFNFVYEHTGGEYFKWVAHDDLHLPAFLQSCVDVLDRRTEVVVAYTRVRIIDESGNPIEDYPFEVRADRESAWRRMAGQIRGHQCFEIFGVIRRAALARTPRMGDYFAGDAVLLVRLGLLGPLVEVPEPLFLSRRHAEQSEVLKQDVQSYTAWFQPAASGRITFPYWRVLGEYLGSVARAPIAPLEKLPCTALVAGWALRRWRHLLRDAGRGAGQLLASGPWARRRATGDVAGERGR